MAAGDSPLRCINVDGIPLSLAKSGSVTSSSYQELVMPTAKRKAKTKTGKDGGPKLASGHGRGEKSGGEAKKPATAKATRRGSSKTK